MRIVVLALFTLFCINAIAGFEEEGFSRNNCAEAKQDALLLAKANCLSLDTQKKDSSVSRCRRDNQGFYKVKITYGCNVEDVDTEDGYSETIDEELDTYL